MMVYFSLEKASFENSTNESKINKFRIIKQHFLCMGQVTIFIDKELANIYSTNTNTAQ
jgi:hypothetical protein